MPELARDSRRSRLRPGGRVRIEVWGVLDQTLVSGVNFLTIVLLARALAPSDFGYFVIAFTILQSAGMLQAALVTRPHNVLGATRSGRPYIDYTTAAAATQVGLACALALLAVLGAAVAYAAGSTQWSLCLVLVPALLGWQLQEFGRRVLYTERRLLRAFANDVLAYGSQAAALVLLLQRDRLTTTGALVTLAVSFSVGAAALGWQLRQHLSGTLNASSLAASWRFGKWLGVAEIGQWFSTHYYIYLAAALLGAVASAALKAAQTLLGPVSVFLTFVTSYLPIVLARELESSGSTRRKVRRSLVAVVPAVVFYCLLVGLFAESVLGLVYGAEYERYADVVQLFALYYVLLAFSTVAVAALSAQRMTRDVFLGHAAGAVVSLASGWLLLLELGPTGGVVGMLVSWTVAMGFFMRALRNVPERDDLPARPAPSPGASIDAR